MQQDYFATFNNDERLIFLRLCDKPKSPTSLYSISKNLRSQKQN